MKRKEEPGIELQKDLIQFKSLLLLVNYANYPVTSKLYPKQNWLRTDSFV